jgi:SpoU rRNA methylase family enzyme
MAGQDYIYLTITDTSNVIVFLKNAPIRVATTIDLNEQIKQSVIIIMKTRFPQLEEDEILDNFLYSITLDEIK